MVFYLQHQRLRMRFTPYLGYVAGALTMISLWPQTRRVRRTKQTQDLSFKTFALLITAGALWVSYGIPVPTGQ
jgi:uncharacterized protein with PQ loop repeat